MSDPPDPVPASGEEGSDADSQAAAFRYRGFPREVVDRVWTLGSPVEGNDPELWRKDEFGAWLHRLDYGNRHSEFGWEIVESRDAGPCMGVAALRPIHWQNYLEQVTASRGSRITADGLRNTRQLL